MDISVITPFYKGNAYLEGLFGCVRRNALKAPHLKIQLVLVNDSPDCPMEYDPRWVEGFVLTKVCNQQNSGIHRSRVNGLSVAEGRFIQFLDQDDLLEEDTFLSQLSVAENTDVVICNGFDQSPTNRGPIYKSLAHQQQATDCRFYYTVGNQIVSPGHCLIRKEAIPAAWCETIIDRNGSDDLLLWLMMFHEKARFSINPQILYTHVDTGENVSANVGKMIDSSMEVLRVLEKHGMISSKNRRHFIRSRSMAAGHVGKPKLQKIISMLRYPDVAWERLVLQHLKKS